MKTFIIKLGAMRDVIRTTAIILGLMEKYRNCKINWITRKESHGILKNNKFIDKTYLSDKGKIKKEKCDLIINLDDDCDACKLASSLKAKKTIGAYSYGNKRRYTEDSAKWFDMGLISKFGKKKADELKAKNKKTYQKIIYEILGLDYKKQEPILILNRKEAEFGKAFAEKNDIDKKNPIIGINTGAGGRWQDKKLSIDETAELINKIKGNFENVNIILFGGPEEKDRNEKIINSVKNSIIDAGCDNSLMEFASLVNLCDILVTSDSLAMHIGTALKKKIVAFFYPTSAAEIELYGRGIKIIGKGSDYCSYKTKCDYPPKWDIYEFIEAVKSLEK